MHSVLKHLRRRDELAHIKSLLFFGNVLNDSHGSHRGTASLINAFHFYFAAGMLAQGAARSLSSLTVFFEAKFIKTRIAISLEITFCSSYVRVQASSTELRDSETAFRQKQSNLVTSLFHSPWDDRHQTIRMQTSKHKSV